MTEHRDEHETYGHTTSPGIDCLKGQLENLSESHLGQRVLIAAMSEERDGMVKLVDQAIADIERLRDEVKRLTAERGEARRDLCDLYVKGQPTSSNMTDKDYAAELGWDCFKEDSK